jgi:hypothetical protein
VSTGGRHYHSSSRGRRCSTSENEDINVVGEECDKVDGV